MWKGWTPAPPDYSFCTEPLYMAGRQGQRFDLTYTRAWCHTCHQWFFKAAFEQGGDYREGINKTCKDCDALERIRRNRRTGWPYDIYPRTDFSGLDDKKIAEWYGGMIVRYYALFGLCDERSEAFKAACQSDAAREPVRRLPKKLHYLKHGKTSMSAITTKPHVQTRDGVIICPYISSGVWSRSGMWVETRGRAGQAMRQLHHAYQEFADQPQERQLRF